MDLFETSMPEDRLHNSFKQILSDPLYAPVKEVIQSWGVGLFDRSGEQKKFCNEFQTTFNSSFWELYLNKVFMELGFHVDYTKASPDFCLKTADGYEFNVEAVVADRSHDSSSNSAMLSNDEPKYHNTVKLAGKIKDKRDIFTGIKGNKFPYSSLEHVQKRPFVIAIAPFNSDDSLMQNNEIINRVLFGLDTPDEDALLNGKQDRILSIVKPSGASVPLGIFTNDSFKEISAVIFSTTGTFSKAVVESGINRVIRATYYRDMSNEQFANAEGAKTLGVNHYNLGAMNYLITTRYSFGDRIFGADMHIYHSRHHHETHSDGLHVYYNPYASIPLETSVMHAKEITHNFYDVKANAPNHRHPDGALISRQAFEPTAGVFERLVEQHRFYGQ